MDNKLKERVERKSKDSISYGTVQSRYLREPVGSCHDLCKHGLKHESVDDRSHLVFRRSMANSIASDPVKGSDKGSGRKKSRIKPKAHEKASVGLFEKSVNSIELLEETTPGGTEQKLKEQLGNDEKALSSNGNNSIDLFRNKSFDISSFDFSESPAEEASSMPKLSHVKRNILKQKESSSSILPACIPDINIPKRKLSSNLKEPITSAAIQVIKQKIAHSAKPVISVRSRSSACRSLNESRKLEGKVSKKNDKSNVGKMVFSKRPKDSVSSPKVLEVTEDKPSKSTTASEGSEVSDNERVSGKQKRVTVKEEDRRRAKRTPAFQSNDGSSSPYKLRFRRGKVIELRAADVVGPKRLRFRRGRVVGENPSSEVVGQRSFRRRRGVADSNDPTSDARAVKLKQTNSEPQVVMLKHQDAQEKKDMQALLNHVIEETASKLVETRKSKVKALVGAFETVISLQETKPAAAV